MAKIFRGMSQDNFLDGLVEKTGLNGHELYDYVVKLVGDKPAKEEEKEKKLFFPHGEYVFTGDLDELREFYKSNGGSEEIAQWFGAMVSGLAAIHVASIMELEKFSWVRPMRCITAGGKLSKGWFKYSCWWKPEEQKYNCDDGIEVKQI